MGEDPSVTRLLALVVTSGGNLTKRAHVLLFGCLSFFSRQASDCFGSFSGDLRAVVSNKAELRQRRIGFFDLRCQNAICSLLTETKGQAHRGTFGEGRGITDPMLKGSVPQIECFISSSSSLLSSSNRIVSTTVRLAWRTACRLDYQPRPWMALRMHAAKRRNQPT